MSGYKAQLPQHGDREDWSCVVGNRREKRGQRPPNSRSEGLVGWKRAYLNRTNPSIPLHFKFPRVVGITGGISPPGVLLCVPLLPSAKLHLQRQKPRPPPSPGSHTLFLLTWTSPHPFTLLNPSYPPPAGRLPPALQPSIDPHLPQRSHPWPLRLFATPPSARHRMPAPPRSARSDLTGIKVITTSVSTEGPKQGLRPTRLGRNHVQG